MNPVGRWGILYVFCNILRSARRFDMMKHILTLILALSVLFLTGCDRDANAPTGYKTASGEAADYYFFVPDDWTVDMATGATSAYCSKPAGLGQRTSLTKSRTS